MHDCVSLAPSRIPIVVREERLFPSIRCDVETATMLLDSLGLDHTLGLINQVVIWPLQVPFNVPGGLASITVPCRVIDHLRISQPSSRVSLTLSSLSLLLHSHISPLVNEADLLAVLEALRERHLLLVLRLRVELEVAFLLACFVRGRVDVLIVLVIFVIFVDRGASVESKLVVMVETSFSLCLLPSLVIVRIVATVLATIITTVKISLLLVTTTTEGLTEPTMSHFFLHRFLICRVALTELVTGGGRSCRIFVFTLTVEKPDDLEHILGLQIIHLSQCLDMISNV